MLESFSGWRNAHKRFLVLMFVIMAALTALITDKIPGINLDETFARWAREERVERIDAALAKCVDSTACLGGFVRYRFNNHILRIDDCRGTNCRSRELPVAELAFWAKITDMNEISEIVLSTDSKWPEIAVEYERQFVVSEKLRP